MVAEIIPAKKHYLYKNKVRFALKNASGVMIKEVRLPSGEMKNDPYFGLIESISRRSSRKSLWNALPSLKPSPFMRLIRGARKQTWHLLSAD